MCVCVCVCVYPIVQCHLVNAFQFSFTAVVQDLVLRFCKEHEASLPIWRFCIKPLLIILHCLYTYYFMLLQSGALTHVKHLITYLVEVRTVYNADFERAEVVISI